MIPVELLWGKWTINRIPMTFWKGVIRGVITDPNNNSSTNGLVGLFVLPSVRPFFHPSIPPFFHLLIPPSLICVFRALPDKAIESVRKLPEIEITVTWPLIGRTVFVYLQTNSWVTWAQIWRVNSLRAVPGLIDLWLFQWISAVSWSQIAPAVSTLVRTNRYSVGSHDRFTGTGANVIQLYRKCLSWFCESNTNTQESHQRCLPILGGILEVHFGIHIIQPSYDVYFWYTNKGEMVYSVTSL